MTYSIDLHFFNIGGEWCMVCTKPDGTETGMIPMTSEQVKNLQELTKDLDLPKENERGRPKQ